MKRGYSFRLACVRLIYRTVTVDLDSGLLHWLYTAIINAKAFILGTYHGLPKKNLQSYLDEYSFRFSRRSFGPKLLERLTLAVGTSARLS